MIPVSWFPLSSKGLNGTRHEKQIFKAKKSNEKQRIKAVDSESIQGRLFIDCYIICFFTILQY